MNEPAKIAWAERPFQTAIRIAATYLLRLHPSLCETRLSFDENRSVFIADLRTSLGLGMYRYGYHDAELAAVGKILQPGETFIDGGANVGLFSLVAAARVGREGKVVSFEPAPDTRARLERNRAANDYAWMEIRPEALGDTYTTAEFIAFGGNSSGVSSFAPAESVGGQKQRVQVVTLDSVIQNPRAVRLIKLDLEGAEYKALQGAHKTLTESTADVMIEIEPAHLQRQGSNAEDIFAYFRRLGFQSFKIVRNSPNYLMTRNPERLRALSMNLL